MDAVFPQISTQELRGTVGNDFIDVHVMTGSCACLERIDNKLIVPLPVNHFLRGLDDGICLFCVKQAQVPVDFGSGSFDHSH